MNQSLLFSIPSGQVVQILDDSFQPLDDSIFAPIVISKNGIQINTHFVKEVSVSYQRAHDIGLIAGGCAQKKKE